MSIVSLPSRQRLSRRVQFFGDNASDYRTSLQNRSDLTQWQKMIMLDPEGQSEAGYMANHAAAPDMFPLPIPAEYLQYLKDVGAAVTAPPFQNAPVTAPVIPTEPQNTGILNPPGLTTEDYVSMVEKNKTDADALARQNALRSSPAENFQPDPPVTGPVSEPAPTITEKVVEQADKNKSLMLPIIAGIAALVFLKG